MESFQSLDNQVHSLRRQVESTEAQLHGLKLQLQKAEQQAEASGQLHQAYAGGFPDEWINETLAALSPSVQASGLPLDQYTGHEQRSPSTGMTRTKSSTQGRWPLADEEYKRYGRQLILPEIGLHGQMRLKNAKVLVVGVGGLGCPAAAYLAGAGVGTLGLMDGDTVEVSNLHRQIVHGIDRVGMSKVDSAVKFLSSYVAVLCIAFTYSDNGQSQPTCQIPTSPQLPFLNHGHPNILPVRSHTRLHGPPNLTLPYFRRQCPNRQTSRLRLRAENRRPAHRLKQSSSSTRRLHRRTLLSLRLS
jgi:hypothetical protein